MKKYVVSVSGIKPTDPLALFLQSPILDLKVDNKLYVTRIESESEEEAERVVIEKFKEEHPEYKVSVCVVMEI